jgi:hypothetical protein
MKRLVAGGVAGRGALAAILTLALVSCGNGVIPMGATEPMDAKGIAPSLDPGGFTVNIPKTPPVSAAIGKELSPKGPTVRIMPWAYLDNLYCLSSGDAGVMVFGFRNEAGAPIQKPQLLLQLPAAVEILDLDSYAGIVSSAAKLIQDRPIREYRIDLGQLKGAIHDASFNYPYNQWDGLALLLRTAEPPGDIRHEARYWIEDGPYRSEPLSFDIQIVPPIPETGAPKRFRSGLHPFLVHRFMKPEGVKAFAALCRRVGFNAIHIPACPLGTETGRVGLERYAQPVDNGYNIGDAKPGGKPESAVFRLVDGTPLWEGICPVEVYEKGPYYRNRIENDLLRRVLVTERQAEQVMANWEPEMYNGRGCFCGRCKKEFQVYSKLSSEEVDRIWPKSVIAERGEMWVKFRAWQHGKLMATLAESVHALGKEAGLDSQFIPEIHYSLLTDFWNETASHREYAAVDYLDTVHAFVPWSPYNWNIFGVGPWEYVCGLHLNCHVTAQEVQAFLAKRLPEGKRPRLFAFPYGTYEGATQPEAIAFEVLTYLLDGYDGAFVYLFPGGYDARYWKAMGEANRLIAQYEGFIFDGERVNNHRATAESPLPKPDPRFLSTAYLMMPSAATRGQDVDLLQSWEFERDDSRLIVVGNFWERGECFFRLTPGKLDSRTKYVLHEPAYSRVYADATGRIALSAEELSRGILAHVGAMRFAFLILEPYRDGVDYGVRMRPQDMEAALAARLPSIRAAQAADAGSP